MVIVISVSAATVREHKEQEENPLEIKVKDFVLENEPMVQAVAKLRLLGVQICFEQVRTDPIRVIDKDGRRVEYGGQTNIVVKLHEATIKDILNELVSKDTQYVWERWRNSEVINIIPRKNPVLNWTVDKIVIENKPVREVLGIQIGRKNSKDVSILQDKLGLRKHKVFDGLVIRGTAKWLETPISLKMENASIRDCLNAICTQVKIGWPVRTHRLCWTLAGLGDKRGLNFGFTAK